MISTFKLLTKKFYGCLSNSVILVCGYHTKPSEKICTTLVIPYDNISYNSSINHYFIDNAIFHRVLHTFICTSVPWAFSIPDIIIIKCLILNFY